MAAESLFAQMTRSVVEGDPEAAGQLAREALGQGLDPLEVISRGFVPGVNEVGRGFSCGEMFLPDLVSAGNAMKAAMLVLEPELVKRGAARESAGTVVIGVAKGDIHEIGKNLVGTMLTANGFTVHDLGVDVPPEKFISRAKETNADLVCISALLTTTMTGQRTLLKQLDEAGLRPRCKVMVGGAPVTRDWAREIGADGYSEDATGAVKVARQLLGVTEA